MISAWLGSISAGFQLDLAFISYDFAWIWFDFGLDVVGFRLGFPTFGCFYYEFCPFLASHRLSELSRRFLGSPRKSVGRISFLLDSL